MILSRLDRIRPLPLGFGIAGGLVFLLLVSESLLGRWGGVMVEGEFDALAQVSSGVLRDFRIAFVHCLASGYVAAAFVHVIQRGRRTVLSLQDTLDCTPAECAALADSVTLTGRGLALAALLGLAFAVATPYVVPPVPEAPWNPATWSAEVVWHRILGPLAGILQMWLAYAIAAVSLRMSAVAERLERIDLLDLSPLQPFIQQGMRNALVLTGLLSIFSLMMIETGMGRIMLFAGGSWLVLISLALVLPIRGLHRKIRTAKEAELEWANRAIAAERRALAAADTSRRSGDMADLVAYRNLVAAVSEWPFTSSNYARILLYALIPAASWGLGVIAEQIVERMIE